MHSTLALNDLPSHSTLPIKLNHPRLAYWLAAFTCVVTWCLIVLGGVVHNTVSSLACPDWPLCYGEVFPELEGGILYEHGHRYLGGFVGMSTIALVALLWGAHVPLRRGQGLKWGALLYGVVVGLFGGFLITPTGQARIMALGMESAAPGIIAAIFLSIFALAWCCILWRPEKGEPNLAFKAIGLLLLVIFQGLLGGATVTYRLPDIVSTGHLATSMLVLLTWVYVAFELRRQSLAENGALGPGWSSESVRGLRPLLYLATGAVYFQIVLGALVRHTGSYLAAGMGWGSAIVGTDPVTGDRTLWPSTLPAQLNMTHRYFALLVALIVILCCARVWMKVGPQAEQSFARIMLIMAPIKLVLLQILVGVVMLGMLVEIYSRTAHLGVAALLLVSLFLLTINLRTAWAPTSSMDGARGGASPAP